MKWTNKKEKKLATHDLLRLAQIAVVICLACAALIFGLNVSMAKTVYINLETVYQYSSPFPAIAKDDGIIELRGDRLQAMSVGSTDVQSVVFGIPFNSHIVVEDPYFERDCIVTNCKNVESLRIYGTETTPIWHIDDMNLVYEFREDDMILAAMVPGVYNVSATVNMEDISCEIVVEDPKLYSGEQVEAYQTTTMSVTGTKSMVEWKADPPLQLIPNGNDCSVYCHDSGKFVVSATVNGMTLWKEITFLEHTHTGDSDWITLAAPSCETTGERALICSVCGEQIQTEPIEATGHVPGSWKTIQSASVYRDGIDVQACVSCGKELDRHSYSYADLVASEVTSRGMYGRLNIPDVGVSVALFKVSIYDGKANQAVVNRADSAAYMLWRGVWSIGDHSTQGFYKIKSCIPYTTYAYITTQNGTDRYLCVARGNGVNIRKDLLDANGSTLYDTSRGVLLMYTCNEDNTITYTHWVLS